MATKEIMSAVLAPEEAVPALKIIGSVQALNIQSPADVIVIKIAFPVGAAEIARVIDMWKETTKLPNPVVALVEGVDVNVVRPPTKG